MTQSFLNKGELGEILVIRKLFEYSKINDIFNLVKIFGNDADMGIKVLDIESDKPILNDNSIKKTKSTIKPVKNQPSQVGDNLYQSRERAESSLKAKIKWYEKIRTEMEDENYQQDDFFDKPRRALINQMEELGYTWDDLEVREYYLGLIPATTSI